MMNFEFARQQMLSQQIRAWDVLDQRVLDVVRDTPREIFVPEAERDLAFADTEIPLPHGQHMMAPKVEARLLQDLAVTTEDAALEIGTGSGYLTACLGRLAASVLSLEVFADLSDTAGSRLKQLDVNNVELRTADAMQSGFDNQFDVIAVTASLPQLPEKFVRWLRPGGRMFIVVGQDPVMEAQLVHAHADGSHTVDSLFETMLLPMINASEPDSFVL